MAQIDISAWYVLTCKPRHEAYVEEQLNNQGYITYRPLAIRKRRRRGKLLKVTESLFPCYLFIQLNRVGDNWASIRSTYGVYEFVRFGGYPLTVTGALVTELQEHEGQFQGEAVDLDCLHRGGQVMICNGSFLRLEAMFEHCGGEERALLLMRVLNEQAKVTVASSDLYKMA